MRSVDVLAVDDTIDSIRDRRGVKGTLPKVQQQPR